MAHTVTCDTCGQPLGNPACAVCRRYSSRAAASSARPAPVPDRRDPRRQVADPEQGKRVTDPVLTTRDCADRLGVSTAFIVGEIRDGRLPAMVIERDGMRTLYRVAPAELEAYMTRHRWKHQKKTAS